jgi:catechol 2,3-dioxygenase-like lactoylglutathione lyase family enzyme
VTRLHHVNIVVRPEQTSDVVDFYSGVFDLQQIAKPAEGTTGGGAWLAVDDRTQLHVSERPDAGAHPDQHYALVVDDFEGVLVRLRERAAPWVDQADLFGGRRGWTRDPAGNRIEVCERAGTLA